PVKGGPFWGFDYRMAISLSPDGHYAITFRPPLQVPESWEGYEGELGRQAHALRRLGQSKFQIGFLDQAMLINTDTGDIQPLVDAPTPFQDAFWYPDSRCVILTGTHLPLSGVAGNEVLARKTDTYLAEFTIPNRTFRVIAKIPKQEFWEIEPG